MRRRQNVQIRWLYDGEDSDVLEAQVLIRDTPSGEEMVVDVEDPEADSPYHMVGRRPPGRSCFVATNTARDRTADVWASWAEIDGEWVGRWTEAGCTSLFSFVF